MNIGVDIDNVISNFNEVLLKEFIAHDKELRNAGIVNKNAYITRGMFDWTKEEFDDFYYKNIERIAKNLNIIEGADFYIKKLRQDGHKIYIITGRDNGEYSNPFEMTLNWLKKYKIEYDEIFFTNNFSDDEKANACLKNNVKIMIDDSKKNSYAVAKAGITALLMDTEYNRDAKDLIRVHNWKEIYEYISNYKEEKLNVILDTDIGNECDDQFAMSYLLKYQDKFDINAITIAPYEHKKFNKTIKENQLNSYDEVLKIAKLMNVNLNGKVFKGSEGFILQGYNETNDAVNKIIEIALNNNKTYILAIGAITNIALAIKKEPKIIDKIEVVWLGGHSFLQNNNNEFNFKQDIQAVKIVLNSKVKLTIVPCKNVASNLRTSIYELNHYLKDKSKLCNYLIDKFYNDGYHGIQERRALWDVAVVAYMVNKYWFTSNEVNVPNINDDTSYELTNNEHKITMVNYLDVDRILTDLFRKIGELL